MKSLIGDGNDVKDYSVVDFWVRNYRFHEKDACK
jgi:hypothetical protein